MGLIDCNLALKGGVTSGLVHAGALPALSHYYRLKGISGSSAGAIAAAFAAAAEYARTRGDAEAFERLKNHSAELPSRLLDLFQPSPGLEPLASALILLAPGTGRAKYLRAALCFWPSLLAGLFCGVVLGAFLASGAGAIRIAVVSLVLGLCGTALGLGLYLANILRRAAHFNFGICTGLSQTGRPALTDWVHECLQDIAFGSTDRHAPLTFGDLEREAIDLRIVTTNLSTGRAEITPALGKDLYFRRSEWARQFPQTVMAHLMREGTGDAEPIPPISELPVLIAVRISMACPGLMGAVPATTEAGARVWFSDGGLTTNFPFDVFNGDPRPTLALDLDTMQTEEPNEPRVRTFDPLIESAPPNLTTVRGFIWSLLVALREGHLKTTSRRPERNARIYQARLLPDEGGMKLDMLPHEALALMQIGMELASYVIETELAKTT